ncbi:MAG: adenylate/guanylate cyclase domain-containing protein [Solirubrobacteraceae bacterium]|nr:adenylate/guanylate cyclase domain-containing protein [Solirubrobacteraceae bacterium]
MGRRGYKSERDPGEAGVLAPASRRQQVMAFMRSPRFRYALIRVVLSTAMVIANLIGAAVAFVMVVWVVPFPALDELDDSQWWIPFIALGGYLVVAIGIGIVLSLKRTAPVRTWAISGRPATPLEQDLILKLPRQLVAIQVVLWVVGGTLFTLWALVFYSPELAFDVAISAFLAALGTWGFAYLSAERILRPLAADSLSSGAPANPTTASVSVSILLTWGLSTGVPVIALALIGLGELVGILEATPDDLAVAMLALAAVALIVGFLQTILVARSIADPIVALRKAIGQLRLGDLDAHSPVYDGSEIGQLQAGFNEMVDGLRERERLHDLFGRQVGHDVARLALERGVQLGGEQREIAVLFIDIVGSTAMAFERPATEVVALLNRFFEVVVEITDQHGGFVNKFEGDAALCIFGAPLDREDAAGDALRAARALRDALEQTVPELTAAIGVSAGPAVAGNVGSAARFEYTVIGDPVNEASRLTELAKSTPGRLLASAAVVDRADPDEPAFWELDGEVVLRGRSEPTALAVPISRT